MGSSTPVGKFNLTYGILLHGIPPDLLRCPATNRLPLAIPSTPFSTSFTTGGMNRAKSPCRRPLAGEVEEGQHGLGFGSVLLVLASG
jgi:hypothetical protein